MGLYQCWMPAIQVPAVDGEDTAVRLVCWASCVGLLVPSITGEGETKANGWLLAGAWPPINGTQVIGHPSTDGTNFVRCPVCE